jgi:hypothetical protein
MWLDDGMTNHTCSYCSEDIAVGEPFHTHRVRDGKAIHATCLADHLARKSAKEVARVMAECWNPVQTETEG